MLVCVCVSLLKEGSDLHAYGLKGVPGALPVHPHHAVVRAVFGHAARVSPAPVIPPVGIG